MKIRTGFVSNSSSSSFILVVKEDYYNEKLKDQHPYVKAVFDDLMKTQNVLGIPCRVFGDLSVQDCSVMDYYGGPDNYDGPELTEKPEGVESKWYDLEPDRPYEFVYYAMVKSGFFSEKDSPENVWSKYLDG